MADDVRVHSQGHKLLAVVIDKLLAADSNETSVRTRCTLKGEQQGNARCNCLHIAEASARDAWPSRICSRACTLIKRVVGPG